MGRRAIANRVRKLGEDLGRRPTLEEVLELHDVSRGDITKNFSSFSEVLRIAGLMKTREQVVKERKKRGYVPPWNALPDGETKMETETARAWRLTSIEYIAKNPRCEEIAEHNCRQDIRLVVHHIIPRRCGGEIFLSRNLVVLCDVAHKMQIADLYWRTADDIDLKALPEYQLRRLSEGTYGLASTSEALETESTPEESVSPLL